MHTPAPSKVTVRPALPPTLHTNGVPDVNVTANFDEAFAFTSNNALPIVRAETRVNVMVCETNDTTKLRVTTGATPNTLLPPCDAEIVHTPAASNNTLLAFTAHTNGVDELNVTGNFDDAFAFNTNTGFFIV